MTAKTLPDLLQPPTMTLLQPLFQNLSDGVCISDAGGRVLYMNPAASALLDLPPDGQAPSSLCELLCESLASRPADCARKCPLRRPRSFQTVVTIKGTYGRLVRRSLRVHCQRMDTPLFGASDKHKHFIVIEDISADEKLEACKEDWRNMVAHDLRNPLTNIYGCLMTLSSLPLGHQLLEKERALLNISARAAKRMGDLLDMFLKLARLDAGVMPARLLPVDLAAIIRDCTEEQEFPAAAKHIEIQNEVPADCWVRADRDLLVRVVQNVLSDAVKFTPDYGRVTLSKAEADGRVTLRVKDTCPGIAAADLPFVFDRFYQGKAGALRGTGSGLGLAFCREALKAMKGSISVKSAPGQGCEFSLDLSSAQKRRCRPPRGRQAPRHRNFNGHHAGLPDPRAGPAA